MEAMDPKQAECVGFFLYGSGYFTRDSGMAGLLLGASRSEFCGDCPARVRCEKQHVRRVRRIKEEEVVEFDKEVREGKKRGLTPLLVSIGRYKAGRPDPFMATALENFQRGVGDRGTLFDETATG